jgi:hypothetical protein
MKKIIIVVLILILAMLCLTSCDQPTDFGKLNEMVSTKYLQMSIKVAINKSGEANGLVSDVVCLILSDTTKQVAYNLQEYATFDMDGDTITAPSEQIITKSGNVTIENGNVTSFTGDRVDYDFSNIGALNMTFSETCLANAKTADGTFTADITNISAFLGSDIVGATNAKVSVNVKTYSSITISYTANGSDVIITYTFG